MPKKELTNATWMFFCRVRERQRKVRATVAPQTNLQEQRADSGAKREGAMLKIGRYPEVGGTTKKATWLLTTVLPKRFGAPGALGTSLLYQEEQFGWFRFALRCNCFKTRPRPVFEIIRKLLLLSSIGFSGCFDQSHHHSSMSNTA